MCRYGSIMGSGPAVIGFARYCRSWRHSGGVTFCNRVGIYGLVQGSIFSVMYEPDKSADAIGRCMSMIVLFALTSQKINLLACIGLVDTQISYL